MKLGSLGQAIVIESGPAIKVRTSDCDGTSGIYPVTTPPTS